MKRKLLALTAILLALTVTFGGCENIMLIPGKSSGAIADGSSSSQNSESLSAYPVTLNNTEITKAPEKIVSLTPAYTEILFEMGYGKKITAVSDYCDYPETVKELPKAASSANPDIAAIKKLKPDLVITATPIVTKDKISLEAQGIKVLVIPSPRNIEEFENVYKFFGLAMNGQFDGEAAGEKAFSPIKKQLDAIKKTDKKFIYVTAANTPAGGDTFESAVLSLFGTNIAESSSGYSYKAADLADNQPDIIFVSDTIGEDTLTANENYSDLKAVKDGKITMLKNKYFERPSGRITELLTEIAKAFPTEKPETASSKTESTNNKESNKENSKETENSKPEPVPSDVSE